VKELTLKIETTLLDDQQAKLTVEIEPERLEETKRQAANKLAKRVKIPGFRPGKAPYPVVLRAIGEGAVLEEALEILVDRIYPEIIKEAEIKPYGPGRLEKISETTDPLTLTFIVPLDAEVKLGDYKAIRKDYLPEPVSEAEIEESLESLRRSQAIVEPVERAAEKGDVVTILLSAKSLSETTDADEGPLLQEQSIPFLLDEDNDHWPFPGFKNRLIGKSANDQESFEYTFPADFEQESMQNESALFTYTVESVKSRTLPDLNDELAVSLGEFDTLEALRANIQSMHASRSEEKYNATYDDEVLTEAIGQSEFKYPPQMLEDEIDQVLKDLESRLERQNLDLDIYRRSRDLDEAGLREELRPVAKERLERSLFLFELGREEAIQVKPEELTTETENALNYLRRALPEKEARRLNSQEAQTNIVNNVLVDLLSRKTIERMRNIARGIQMEQAAQEDAEPTEAEEVTMALSEPVIETELSASVVSEAQPEAISSEDAPSE